MTKLVKKKSLGSITFFLIVTGALSRILGYAREIVITTTFGQNFQTDAYKSAFLIPDFLYLILVGGAFSTAFIPVLSKYLSEDDEEGWIVSSTIINLVFIFLLVGMLFSFAFTPFLIDQVIAPGYSPEAKGLAVMLTRIMLIQSLFMCLSGIAQGICHVHQEFVAPAIGPLLYNIFIILFGLWLIPVAGIAGFAVGVVVGSFLNFVVHLPTLRRIDMHYHLVIDLKHKGVRHFFKLVLPVLLGLSVIYLNTFVTMRLGSYLDDGANTLLNNANRLMQLPVGIFGIAVASAFFPTLTNYINESNVKGFKDSLLGGINLVSFILMPAMFGIMVVREPLIRALFLQGEFTEDNVIKTASVLLFYAIGILGYSQQQILNRGYYALSNTKGAVLINSLVVGLNIVLSYLFIKPMGAEGLALAYSIAGTLSMILLYLGLKRQVRGLNTGKMLNSFIKTFVASLVMGLAVWAFVHFAEPYFNLSMKSAQLLELYLAILIGVGVYIVMAAILKIEEMDMMFDKLLLKFGKK